MRQEKKFLLGYDEYIVQSHLLGSVMIPDEHNGFFGYVVRSLYFDTIQNKDYEEKMDLEIKQKEGNYQMKRSLKVTKEDALELINMNYDVLLKYDSDFARECFSIMSMQQYIPKTVVEYNRKAYIAKENSIRITFDSHINANEVNFNIFDEKLPLYPVFPPDQLVLEVKFNGFLLSYIKDLLDTVQKSELSVSKYCLARSASMNYVYC